jgi:hypothetical protein
MNERMERIDRLEQVSRNAEQARPAVFSNESPMRPKESPMKCNVTPEDPRGLEDLAQPVEELTPEQAEAAEGGMTALFVAAGAAVVGGVVGDAVGGLGEKGTLRALRPGGLG